MHNRTDATETSLSWDTMLLVHLTVHTWLHTWLNTHKLTEEVRKYCWETEGNSRERQPEKKTRDYLGFLTFNWSSGRLFGSVSLSDCVFFTSFLFRFLSIHASSKLKRLYKGLRLFLWVHSFALPSWTWEGSTQALFSMCENECGDSSIWVDVFLLWRPRFSPGLFSDVIWLCWILSCFISNSWKQNKKKMIGLLVRQSNWVEPQISCYIPARTFATL